MDSIEIEAKTVEEAVRIALEKLKISRADVEVKVLSEEGKGLFGMEGAKPARVRVTLKKGLSWKNIDRQR
jgi:spoIIIJ-associated protein